MDRIEEAMRETPAGLMFANLVDFDTLYGHRNDVARLRRQPRALRRAPRASCFRELRERDLLVVTADHGNDPTTPSTDHSREYVPLLLTGRACAGMDLGTRRTFADLGQTLAANFGVGPLAHGTSFLEEIVVQHP